MTDLARTAGRIRCLPHAHRALTARLAHTNPPPTGLTGHTQRGSTVPLNLETDAIARDIAYTLELAGEITADLTRRPDPIGLPECAELIANHIGTLAALPWIACHRQPCREVAPEIVSGLEILEHLDRVYRLARTALGIPSDHRQLIETWRHVKSHR